MWITKTVQMRRLICVFVVRCPKVLRLIHEAYLVDSAHMGSLRYSEIAR